MTFGPPFTSTPKREDESMPTQHEHKWRKILQKTTIEGRRKKSLASRKSHQAKENDRRSKLAKNNKRFTPDNAAEKRRKQAIESMKIYEQRRRRILIENNTVDNLTDRMDKLTISDQNQEFLPDGRLKLTKKQLISRDIKQNRIRKFYEDQQRRQGKNPISSTVAKEPEAGPSTVPPRIKKSVKFAKVNETVTYVPDVEEVKEKPVVTAKNFIRYTKEELMEMCPFGTYFFRRS